MWLQPWPRNQLNLPWRGTEDYNSMSLFSSPASWVQSPHYTDMQPEGAQPPPSTGHFI